jgi:hypothetical protein
VIAAHGGSMLIYVSLGVLRGLADYFVYSYGPGSADADAVNAARRPPPSLCLLPPYYCASNRSAIGILRRGEVDELVVVELRKVSATVAELLLFGAGEQGRREGGLRGVHIRYLIFVSSCLLISHYLLISIH